MKKLPPTSPNRGHSQTAISKRTSCIGSIQLAQEAHRIYINNNDNNNNNDNKNGTCIITKAIILQ